MGSFYILALLTVATLFNVVVSITKTFTLTLTKEVVYVNNVLKTQVMVNGQCPGMFEISNP